jgi:hypothetical protein
MRAAVTDRGRDPGDLGVVGTLVPVRDDEKNVDLAQTMASVPAFREAGVTDFRINLAVPSGQGALADYLGEVVAAFRSASA